MPNAEYELPYDGAKEAFSEFLNDTNLDSRQIYFVNQKGC